MRNKWTHKQTSRKKLLISHKRLDISSQSRSMSSRHDQEATRSRRCPASSPTARRPRTMPPPHTTTCRRPTTWRGESRTKRGSTPPTPSGIPMRHTSIPPQPDDPAGISRRPGPRRRPAGETAAMPGGRGSGRAPGISPAPVPPCPISSLRSKRSALRWQSSDDIDRKATIP